MTSDLRLSEFDKNRRIDEQKALIFDGKCRYDVILGADFLTKLGIDINYSTGTMHWFENVRPMREPWKLDNSEYNTMDSAYDIQHDDELIWEDWLDSYLTLQTKNPDILSVYSKRLEYAGNMSSSG